MAEIVLSDPGLVENSEDNARCLHACVQMLMKANASDGVFSFEEIDKILRRKDGYYSWVYAVWQALSQKGFCIKYFNTFDIPKFLVSPEKYLLDRWGEEAGRVQVQKTDIPVVLEDAQRFLGATNIEVNYRSPITDDIKQLLSDGWYVIPLINAKIMNRQEGYAGHFIFIYGFNDDGIFFHDPGIPPVGSRFESWELFEKAWTRPETRSMTACKRMA